MSSLDREVLAERSAALARHLERVAERLPARPDELLPESDAGDAVVLHLWQATQLSIDLALAACAHFRLGTPGTYADAFRSLAEAGCLEPDLAEHLIRAAGFRNLVVHAYGRLDMRRVFEAATRGPAHLRSFFAAIARRL